MMDLLVAASADETTGSGPSAVAEQRASGGMKSNREAVAGGERPRAAPRRLQLAKGCGRRLRRAFRLQWMAQWPRPTSSKLQVGGVDKSTPIDPTRRQLGVVAGAALGAGAGPGGVPGDVDRRGGRARVRRATLWEVTKRFAMLGCRCPTTPTHRAPVAALHRSCRSMVPGFPAELLAL